MTDLDLPARVRAFRIAPCAVFNCLECNDKIAIQKKVTDIVSTIASCSWCKAMYKVAWGASDRETVVQMILGRA